MTELNVTNNSEGGCCGGHGKTDAQGGGCCGGHGQHDHGEKATQGEKACTCGPDCPCGCQEGKPCTCQQTCNCGPDCTCGCQEGKPCTCGGKAEGVATQKTCACGPDCTCGCADGKPCTCGGAEHHEARGHVENANAGSKADAAAAGQQADAAATSAAGVATYQVSGMTCEHCVKAVTEEVSAIPGVHDVQVDLASGTLQFASDAPVDFDRVVEAVSEAGDYTVE